MVTGAEFSCWAPCIHCCSCSQGACCLSHTPQAGRGCVLGQGSPTNASLPVFWGGAQGHVAVAIWACGQLRDRIPRGPGRVPGWIQREVPPRKERGLEPLMLPWGTRGCLGCTNRAPRLLSGVWQLMGGSFIGGTKSTGPGPSRQARCPLLSSPGEGVRLPPRVFGRARWGQAWREQFNQGHPPLF